MLSKAQKVVLYISAVLALVLGLVLIIPFRTLPGVTVESGKTLVIIEIAVKCSLLVAVVGLSIYPFILKYRQIANRLERSKVVNVMCYLPLALYLVGMLVLNLNTLSYSQEPLGFALWSLIFIVFIADLMFLVIGFHLFPRLLMKLGKNMTMFLDIALGVIGIGVVVITAVLSSTYLKAFGSVDAFFGTGDPLLFVVYLVGLITFIVLVQAVLKMIKKDENQLYINFEIQKEEEDKIKEVEYRRAYNDILDDFEEYFEKNGNEKPEENQQPVEKQEETLKEFAPSYEEVVKYASLDKEAAVKTLILEDGKAHEFYIQDQLYLSCKLEKDSYSVYFLSLPQEAFELIVEYPGVVTKPESPVGVEWFQITNKGNLAEDLLHKLIDKSAKNLLAIEAEKAA